MVRSPRIGQPRLVRPALIDPDTPSPNTEIPINIAACGADANGAESIVDGPQAAMIVGELKVIVQVRGRAGPSLP